MKIDIPYGTDKITFELADSLLSEIAGPNEAAVEDEAVVLSRALDNPIGSQSFAQFLADTTNVLVIVNDATRPTPTAKVLTLIHDKLSSVKNCKYIVATGIHRAPTPEEYLQIFGDIYHEVKGRVYAHDSLKESDLAYIGQSKNGTEMHINKMAVEADKIIAISSVEPHYFAGYTGGRKSLLPGIAGHKTITQNHKYSLHANAQALALSGNPVHEDMEDAIKSLDKPIFSVQTVLDKDHHVYAATAGDLNASFYEAINRANEIFSVKIKEKADIVIAVAPYPMDIDLYQSQKALEHGKLALKENGILILVSKCRMGLGDDAFIRLMSQAKSPDEVLGIISRDYQVGDHKAAKIAGICQWAQIWGLTDIDPQIMRSVFIKPYQSIQQAVDEALLQKGPDAKVLVLLSASIVVPRV